MSNNSLPTGNTHYVNNVEFQRLMVERHELVSKSTAPVRITDEIGAILLKIAENLSFHRYFINYPFRDEMIGDAIEDCVKRIDNFDCVNYHNPFAYFTQICYFAFQRRKIKEKKRFEGMNMLRENQAIEEGIQQPWDFQNSVVDELWQPDDAIEAGDDNNND